MYLVSKAEPKGTKKVQVLVVDFSHSIVTVDLLQNQGLPM